MKINQELPSQSMNRSMPPGTVIPELAYPSIREAVDWLCRAFGFVERLRIGDHRSQLTFGEGSVIVTRQITNPDTPFAEVSNSASMSTGGLDHSVMVLMADVDSHCERARNSGARIINTNADYPYGEPQYTADDFAGHRWTFSQTITNVDPSTRGGKIIE